MISNPLFDSDYALTPQDFYVAVKSDTPRRAINKLRKSCMWLEDLGVLPVNRKGSSTSFGPFGAVLDEYQQGSRRLIIHWPTLIYRPELPISAGTDVFTYFFWQMREIIRCTSLAWYTLLKRQIYWCFVDAHELNVPDKQRALPSYPGDKLTGTELYALEQLSKHFSRSYNVIDAFRVTCERTWPHPNWFFYQTRCECADRFNVNPWEINIIDVSPVRRKNPQPSPIIDYWMNPHVFKAPSKMNPMMAEIFFAYHFPVSDHGIFHVSEPEKSIMIDFLRYIPYRLPYTDVYSRSLPHGRSPKRLTLLERATHYAKTFALALKRIVSDYTPYDVEQVYSSLRDKYEPQTTVVFSVEAMKERLVRTQQFEETRNQRTSKPKKPRKKVSATNIIRLYTPPVNGTEYYVDLIKRPNNVYFAPEWDVPLFEQGKTSQGLRPGVHHISSLGRYFFSLGALFNYQGSPLREDDELRQWFDGLSHMTRVEFDNLRPARRTSVTENDDLILKYLHPGIAEEQKKELVIKCDRSWASILRRGRTLRKRLMDQGITDPDLLPGINYRRV